MTKLFAVTEMTSIDLDMDSMLGDAITYMVEDLRNKVLNIDLFETMVRDNKEGRLILGGTPMVYVFGKSFVHEKELTTLDTQEEVNTLLLLVLSEYGSFTSYELSEALKLKIEDFNAAAFSNMISLEKKD